METRVIPKWRSMIRNWEPSHDVRQDVAGKLRILIHEGLAEMFTVEVCGADSTGGWVRRRDG
jgi:uncharacterized protein YjaZ